MTKQKSLFYKVTIIAAILLAAYYAASNLHLDFLCNTLSSLNAAMATIVLIYSYTISNNKSTTGKALLFYASACFSWCVADLIWLIITANGQDPSQSNVVIYVYSLTNICLGIAVLIFMFYQFNKWNSVQLLLDTLVISILSAILAWIAFFHKENTWLELFMQDGIISAFSIIIDFLILIGFLITMYSVRKGKIPTYIFLFGFGILIFSVNDLNYYYMYANDAYIPNSLMDVLYVASLILIALGGLWRALGNPFEDAYAVKNIGIGRRWLLLFLYPLAALLDEGFVFSDVVHFIVAITIYKLFSNQVQVAIRNDELYHKELDINSTLEKLVQEQYSELIFLANHDTVTKLHNRRYFIKSLEDSMIMLNTQDALAVFIMDVDRFKTINDTLGHDVGDMVLIELSGRMLKCSKDQAILARLGGDEFALFFKGRYSRDDMSIIAEEIIEACSAPITIGDIVLNITISLGISYFPTDAVDRVSLMRNADIAMYHAKSQGYNRYEFYDPLFYQPQFNISDNEIIRRRSI